MTFYVVVFDTNILFSGLGWKGTPYQCLQLARQQKVISITCQEILDELAEKLQKKQKRSEHEAAEDINQIINFSRLIKIPKLLTGIVVDDPDDDIIIECAVYGNATHIVSGDRHLLSLAVYKNIQIINARDFLNLAI